MRDQRQALFNELLLFIKNNVGAYRSGVLYQPGKEQELDEVVCKFQEFSDCYDRCCTLYPEEKGKLSLFLMIDYAIKHRWIDG